MDIYQLQNWVKELKISPVEIIREEIEMIVLDKLAQSNLGQKLIFKGGTALRLCYGSPRFSQDMDFNAKDKVVVGQLTKLLARIESDSGQIFIKDTYDKRFTLFALLLVTSPLLKQNFSIKIEISKKKYRLKEGDVLLKIASSTVSPLSPLLPTYSLERILLEKRLAVNSRGEPRDFFDLWFVSEKLKRKVSFPRPRVPESQFKGELNQLLPDRLKSWPGQFLRRYERHRDNQTA